MKRTMLCLLAWAALAVAAHSAVAQDLIEPFRTIHPTTYGHYPRAHEGYYFKIEGLFWTIDSPDVARIGRDDIRPDVADGAFFRQERSTLDTSEFGADWTEGTRIGFGHVCDRKGWTFEGFSLNAQNQRIDGSDVDVVFNDPQMLLDGFIDVNNDGNDDDVDGDGIFGRSGQDTNGNGIPDTPIAFDDADDLVRLPVRFDEMIVRNQAKTWGVEVMRLWRSKQRHYGGYWEFSGGVRYLQFRDAFSVRGLGGILDDSFWRMDSENNLVGPQLMARWFRKRGRWQFSTETRFGFMYNYQTMDLKGSIGTNLNPGPADSPLVFGPTGFTSTRHEVEFSPLVDLRFLLNYQLTKAVSINAGWNGVFVDAVSRASNQLDYTLPNMGVLLDENTDNLFMNGLTIGLEVNR